MSRIMLAIAFLLCSHAAFANFHDARLDDSAATYRNAVDALNIKETASELLRRIKTAKANEKALIDAYEAYARVDGGVRAWLQLGRALAETDPLSEKSLSAAYIAYQKAAKDPERIEALLLIASGLRNRLTAFRKEYDAAVSESKKASDALQLIEDTNISSNEEISPDDKLRQDPSSRAALLKATKKQADADTARILESISYTAGLLDKVYQEVATQIPGTNLQKLRSEDNRVGAFALERTSVTFEPRQNKIAVCATFTFPPEDMPIKYNNHLKIYLSQQDAGDNGGSTSGEINSSNQNESAEGGADDGTEGDKTSEENNGNGSKAEANDEWTLLPLPGVIKFDSKNNNLCLVGLESGKTYKIVFSKGFPAKKNEQLKNDAETDSFTVPDLPRSIAFSTRKFILPTSGPGNIPFQVTNVNDFDLEVVRVSDRTLHRHVALGQVGSYLPSSEVEDLKSKFGELVWDGHVAVTNAAAIENTILSESFPARTLLKTRREWIDQSSNHSQVELLSMAMNLPNVDAEKLTITGRFHRDSAEFEHAEDIDRKSSLYALLIRNPVEEDDCESNCKDYIVQWFIDTDIGLTFYQGDKTFTVVARSLSTGAAATTTTVELISADNRVLANGVVDNNGVVSFDNNLTKGSGGNALSVIIAHKGEDISFLTFGAERLDLSRLNLDGRTARGNLRAYVKTDRGIYMPGDTVKVLALLKDINGKAPQKHIGVALQLESRDQVLSKCPFQKGASDFSRL